MKQIIGNLDIEIARNYSKLIDECNSGEIRLEEDGGKDGVILFTRSHAIKHAYEGDYKFFPEITKRLVKEYKIGKALEKIKINVAEMHGVYVNDNEIPFLVMKRLNITPIEDLTIKEKKEHILQYFKQRIKARDAGFVFGDGNVGVNCGFDRNEGNSYMLDFADWGRN